MVDETEKTKHDEYVSSDGGLTEKPTWLKPQHDAGAQHLSDVLRDVTRLVSDWVWEISPDLKFTYMSPRIFETLGFHPAELRNKTLLDLGTPIDDTGETVAINWRRPFRGQLFSAKNKLNDECLIELNGLPVYDQKTGAFTGVRGTATDITEQRRYAASLEKSKEEAEAINHLRADFMNSLAGEMREPLNAILGSSNQIRGGVSSNEDLNGFIGNIISAGNKLDHLARQIYDLAQLETGQTSFTLEPLVPDPIIDECLQNVASLANERKIRIHDVHQWDGSIIVDRQYFKQVLINLITNGITFNRTGGQLTIASSRKDDRRYRLCITDEGEKIPENLQDDLFHPFSHLRNTGDNSVSGLTMAITKKLVESMHGSIGCISKSSIGSTLWIEFPVVSRID